MSKPIEIFFSYAHEDEELRDKLATHLAIPPSLSQPHHPRPGRVILADPFIDDALRWFGDPDPIAGNPWDKGQRLANLVGHERILLILDGLEPLQQSPGPDEGCVLEPAMQVLLRSGWSRRRGIIAGMGRWRRWRERVNGE